MEKITSYKDLIVWKKSVELVKLLYELTKDFPDEERYGLTIQLRRAVVSIPSNIAEGYGRKSQKDRIHFYIMAFGSALEVETQLIVSKELGFGKTEKYKKVEDILI